MMSRQDKPFSLAPLSAPRNLTAELVERLSSDILSGKLPPGTKLPTEQEMVAATGVSRTVVREAVAALRAEGLVMTRQGVGAFVAADIARRPFRIDEASLDLVKEVINVLERMTAAIDAEEDAVAPDLEFHRSIAEAAGNVHFNHLFNYLGALLIPRARLQTFRMLDGDRSAYLRRVNGEHREIFQAIERQDAEAARSAMRLHLSNSRERLRKTMTQSAASSSQ